MGNPLFFTYIFNLIRIYYLQKPALWVPPTQIVEPNSTPLFSKLGILDIFEVIRFEILKFMFYDKNLLPPLLFNLFVTNGQIHCYGTRTASNYRTLVYCPNFSNFQFSAKVQKFGTPFLFQSLVRQIFSALRRKYKIFNLNNH